MTSLNGSTDTTDEGGPSTLDRLGPMAMAPTATRPNDERTTKTEQKVRSNHRNYNMYPPTRVAGDAGIALAIVQV